MSTPESGGHWAVGLAPRALSQLKKFNHDQGSLDIIWTKFRELSAGQFTLDNHTVVIGTSSSIPIYRARLSNDLRIIYHIDIVPDKLQKFDYQAIKILRIDSRAHIDYGFWVKVSTCLHRQHESNEYRERCKFRLPVTSNQERTCSPAKFSHNPFASNASSIEYTEDSTQDKIRAVPISGRYVAPTKSLYAEILGNADNRSKYFHPMVKIKPPPNSDPDQDEIINHKGATVVVGRSGTGKTTALIYKMHGIQTYSTGYIRQLFVTRSRVLAKHVESSFSRLTSSTITESGAASELGEAPEELDRAVVEFDNEIDLRTDLPPRFSELEESHFPLFISFEKLCSLIEGDIQKEEKEKDEQEREEGKNSRCIWSVKPIWERTKIGYEEFEKIYWPQFKHADLLGLTPFLTYTEILGVIKGYSETMECDDGYLSRSQYTLEGLAHKVSAHLDTGTRQRIYSVFEQYRKIKGARLEVDPADRSHFILAYFRDQTKAANSQLLKCLESIHFLYVDEVQDNLMTDIQLLRNLCGNIDNTYWGGDTAQTILAGSGFRIKDLGSYLYTEAYKPDQQIPSNAAILQSELKVNYRSHDGIVQCAASIVDSLYALFPGSLDQLARETGYKDSTELPVVLTGTSSNPALFEEFLTRSSSSLGAHQAILVRSEDMAKQLSSHISEFCPILTIANCKGLEFDDILLYNFFAESESPAAWEFVHGIFKKGHRSRRDSNPPLSLCNDLKLLYVAITRARQRCWFWDHGEVIDAMQQFWLSKRLINIILVDNMQTDWSQESDASQWILKGHEYFAHGMYKLAAGCFKRGGDRADTNRKIATAYYQMSKAKLEILRSDNDQSRHDLRTAAGELRSCAQLVNFENSRPLWFHTAICLELAHETLESADAFVNAGLYERAIRSLLDRNYVKRGVKILLEHGQNLEPQIQEDLLNYCRRHYFESWNFDALLQLFDGKIDEELKFARKHHFQEQLKSILEQYDGFDELARIYLEEGAKIMALDCFIRSLQQHQRVSSLKEGIALVISCAEWTFTLDSRKDEPAVKQLSVLVEKVLTHEARLETTSWKTIRFFQTVIAKNGIFTPDMAKDWDHNNPEHELTKALILHNILRDMSWTRSRDLGVVIPRLGTWKVYNNIVSKLAEAAEPNKMIAARRLFGFRPSSSELFVTPNYVVAEGSLLAQHASVYPFKTQRNSDNELLIPARWVDKIIKDKFRGILNDRLRNIHSGLIRSGLTSFDDFKPHAYPTYPAQTTRTKSSDKQFESRLNLTSLAIESFSPLCNVPFNTEYSRSNPSLVGLWVRHLFDVIYPMDGSFGEFLPAHTTRGRPAYPGARKCIRQYLTEVSSADLWRFVVAYSLVQQLDCHNLCSNELLQPPSGVLSGDRLMEKCMIDAFFDWKESRGLAMINYGLREILSQTYEPLDATVLVHLIESITCEIIFHTRALHSSSETGFADLVLPYSWARSLSKRYSRPHITRDPDSLEILLEVMVLVSDMLKSHDLGRYWIGADPLSNKPQVKDILQLRLCWCAALIFVNSPAAPVVFADAPMYSLVHMAQDLCERIEQPLYRRFNTIIDQESCLQILCKTFTHETLIGLSQQGRSHAIWQGHSGILEVAFTKPDELLNALQNLKL